MASNAIRNMERRLMKSFEIHFCLIDYSSFWFYGSTVRGSNKIAQHFFFVNFITLLSAVELTENGHFYGLLTEKSASIDILRAMGIQVQKTHTL